MSQGDRNKKSRSRRRRRGGGTNGNNPNRSTGQIGQIRQNAQESSHVFWERSNARLGIEASDDAATRSRQPVDHPCAVCGDAVSVERWPKNRYDVRCERCRQEMSQLLDGDEVAGKKTKGHFEGLPKMTPEDLEALAEVRARCGSSTLGNGLQGQRRRRHGGNGGGNRRRGGGDNNNDGQDFDQGEGRKRRRRRRGMRSDSEEVGDDKPSVEAVPQAEA